MRQNFEDRPKLKMSCLEWGGGQGQNATFVTTIIARKFPVPLRVLCSSLFFLITNNAAHGQHWSKFHLHQVMLRTSVKHQKIRAREGQLHWFKTLVIIKSTGPSCIRYKLATKTNQKLQATGGRIKRKPAKKGKQWNKVFFHVSVGVWQKNSDRMHKIV